MANLFLSGRLYDWLIEPLVKGLRRKITDIVMRSGLFPILDICCGTGTQLHLLKSGKEVLIGLDLSLPALKYALHKYPAIPFICADAENIPFKGTSFKGIIISFASHDKSSQVRDDIINEAKRLLKPEGRIVLVDFENPWSRRSRIGSVLVYLIERSGGGEHFRNNRQFLREGGLRSFVKKHDLIEVERHDVELGALAIVVAKLP